MSKISNYVYLIEFKDGDEKTMNKSTLAASIDDIFNDVSKIVKRYRLQNEAKKTHYHMTLFTEDHNISASDYLDHYRNLPRDKYGDKVLDDFDIEIINMFN